MNFNYRTFLWIGAAKSDWNWIITTNIKTRSNRDCYSLEINVNSSCKSVESKCRRLSKEASNISLEFLHPSYSATSIPAKFQSDSNGSTIERARAETTSPIWKFKAPPRVYYREKRTRRKAICRLSFTTIPRLLVRQDQIRLDDRTLFLFFFLSFFSLPIETFSISPRIIVHA